MTPGRLTLAFLLSAVLAASGASAADQRLGDILVSPERFWNAEVTVAGRVSSTVPDPPGTTRGTYALVDEETGQSLTVRTQDLPGVGTLCRVNGIVQPDSRGGGLPVLKESRRSVLSDPSSLSPPPMARDGGSGGGGGGGGSASRSELPWPMFALAALVAGVLLLALAIALVWARGRRTPTVAAARPTDEPGRFVRFEITHPDGRIESRDLGGSKPISIGRASDNDLVLGDPEVSSYHGRFDVAAGGELSDLASRNGTFVNGVRMSRSRVGPTDTVKVGATEIQIYIG